MGAVGHKQGNITVGWRARTIRCGHGRGGQSSCSSPRACEGASTVAREREEKSWGGGPAIDRRHIRRAICGQELTASRRSKVEVWWARGRKRGAKRGRGWSARFRIALPGGAQWWIVEGYDSSASSVRESSAKCTGCVHTHARSSKLNQKGHQNGVQWAERKNERLGHRDVPLTKESILYSLQQSPPRGEHRVAQKRTSKKVTKGVREREQTLVQRSWRAGTVSSGNRQVCPCEFKHEGPFDGGWLSPCAGTA